MDESRYPSEKTPILVVNRLFMWNMLNFLSSKGLNTSPSFIGTNIVELNLNVIKLENIDI